MIDFSEKEAYYVGQRYSKSRKSHCCSLCFVGFFAHIYVHHSSVAQPGGLVELVGSISPPGINPLRTRVDLRWISFLDIENGAELDKLSFTYKRQHTITIPGRAVNGTAGQGILLMTNEPLPFASIQGDYKLELRAVVGPRLALSPKGINTLKISSTDKQHLTEKCVADADALSKHTQDALFLRRQRVSKKNWFIRLFKRTRSIFNSQQRVEPSVGRF